MKVLILLGGEPPSTALLRAQLDWAEYVIAADSGVDPLLELGVEPDLLTGDFDSVKSNLAGLTCRVERNGSEYATDFEKALAFADTASTLHILGAMGRRNDHFIGNLLIAAGIEEGLVVVLLSDHEVLHRITPQCPLIGRFTEGAIASLLPFASCRGVITTGLKWNLDDVVMGVGEQLGQSNVVQGPEVSVSIASGTMYFALQSIYSK